MKKAFTKIFSFFAAAVLIAGAAAVYSSAENAIIAFSNSKPAVGDSITVTVTLNPGKKMYGTDFTVSYDADVLTYNSADCSANAAGAGIVKAAPAPAGETKVSYKFTFTAKAAGASVISVNGGVYGETEDYTVGASATLNVSDATKSGVATLKALSLSSGKLSPAFNANKTSYTASVAYEVESCKVYATATDAAATVAVDGKEALAVGKNTRTVTVTAQNGTQKTYTIVITRLKKNEEPAVSEPADADPDEPTLPEEDPTEAIIDDGIYRIASDLTGINLPNGFSAVTVTRKNGEVAAAQSPDGKYTVYYLKADSSDVYVPYTLSKDGESFEKLKYAVFGNNTYIFADIPANRTVPEDFYKTGVTIGDCDIMAYKSPDAAYTDYYYTYCYFNGAYATYRYDSRENTLQRSPEFVLTAAGDKETNTDMDFIARYNSLTVNAKVVVWGMLLLLVGGITLAVLLIVRFLHPLGNSGDDFDFESSIFSTEDFEDVTVSDGAEAENASEENTTDNEEN